MNVIAERKCLSAGVAEISIAQHSTHGRQSIGSGDAHPGTRPNLGSCCV